MFTLRNTAAIALAATIVVGPVSSWGAASDYKFELVSSKLIGGRKNDVTIKLIHTPDGKPVVGAVIIEAKTDMGPGGMKEMPGKVTPPTTDANGVYEFQTDNGMPGLWALNLAAKVQGEAETVKGVVVYMAGK